MSLSAAFTRVRAMDPYRLDAVLAAFVLIETQVEALLLDVDGGDRTVAHLVGLACAAIVFLHRRATWPAFLGAQAMFFGLQFETDVFTDGLVAPLFVLLSMNVSAAAQISGRQFWLVPLISMVSGLGGMLVDDFDDDLSGLLWTVLFFSGATSAGGRLLDSRRRLSHALRAKTARAEAEEAERAEQAMIAERERIAGELHDIIAHALSGMVVQASAARRLTDTSPDRAREAFGAVEDTGREALGELRRLLGVLRREDEELALAPTPSLAHVESLIRRAEAAGLPTTLAVEGDARELPAGVDVTAYRIVQEALGAALELGGAGRAGVVLRYRREAVEVDVRDDGAKDIDDPRRLMGMRERVALVGGELHVSRPRDGGHVLRARLPVAAEVPA